MEASIPTREVATMVLRTPFFGDELGKFLAEQAMSGTYCLFSARQTFWESAPKARYAQEPWKPWKVHSLPEVTTTTNLPYLSFFAPATTVATDRIGVFGAAAFPCVLRPTRIPNQYQFIGVCSIIVAHGYWNDSWLEAWLDTCDRVYPLNILALADLKSIFVSRTSVVNHHSDVYHVYSAFLKLGGSRSVRAERPLYYNEWAPEIELV